MDAVTAVSGSGPAYVFLFAEALAQAGIAAGLPPALAEKLARETVAGAGEMLHRSALDAGSAARERHFAGRHHRRRARSADGRKRPCAAVEKGGCRGDRTLAKTRRLSSISLGTAPRAAYIRSISRSVASRVRVTRAGVWSWLADPARKAARRSSRAASAIPRLPAAQPSRPPTARRSSRPFWRCLPKSRSRQSVLQTSPARPRYRWRSCAANFPRRLRSSPPISKKRIAPCLPRISATWPRNLSASVCSTF